MRDRLSWVALLLIGLVVPMIGCSNSSSGLDFITISPTSQALTTGQAVQFSVMGTYGNAKHPTTKAVTSGITWSSSNPAVASVDQSGTASALSAGSATITATAQAFNGPTSSSATITVTASGGGTASGDVASITITPSAQSVSGVGTTVQFIAIGTTSSGSTVNLTNSVFWTSSATSVATVNASTGLATSVSAGTTTITALYTNNGGTAATGSASLTVTAATSSSGYTALSLIPSSQSLSASGQTSQLIALGTNVSGQVLNVTGSSQVAWSSAPTGLVTVSATGLLTGTSPGSATVTALLTNTDNSVVTGSSSVSVTSTTPPEPILSLEIIPSSISVDNFQLSGQFIAIGTFSTAPYVRDVTNDPKTTWLSSEPNSFPVNTNSGGGSGASAGIVTAYAGGGATIIAESSSDDGTIQTATATFNCPVVLPPPAGSVSQEAGSCYPGEPPSSQLVSTLTVYQRGLNTTNWLVTAPSATGTANVLHCGPGWTGSGGSVCTASYPTTAGAIVLTSPAGAGAFGGWSSNCVPSDANGVPLTAAPYWTAAGPNYCVVSPVTDNTVGVIVN